MVRISSCIELLVSLTTHLLANTPATIMLNPRNGVSRILQYDELDIFGGRVKAVSETGYKKRFHTVNYGKHVYDDGKLNRAGVGERTQVRAD